MELNTEAARHRQMKRALLGTQLTGEPLFTLYGFLTFILYKDLGASAIAISLLTMLKPVVTTLSFYWSAGLRDRGHKLKANAVWAGIWMRVPFLACPWIDEAWYVIFAAVNYMFFFRAGAPAWMEILKRNLKSGVRERSFSFYSGVAYAEGVILSLAMGSLLDQDPGQWKFLFFGSAVIGLLGLSFIGRVKIETSVERGVEEKLGWKELILRPWRDSWRLMREQPNFSLFQWGFMICGFGIMLIQPALPLLAVDWLGISYLEMAAAISIAKGLGFVLSTPGWARWFEKGNIGRVASGVFLVLGFFPCCLALALTGIGWLYVAYFLYGVGQAGSHLVWNMSGPFFAGKEESSRYTGVNVVMAGLRGAVGPSLGGWLTFLWGPIEILCIGGLLCFYSGVWLFRRTSDAESKKTLSME
jgi:hypothetical protein